MILEYSNLKFPILPRVSTSYFISPLTSFVAGVGVTCRRHSAASAKIRYLVESTNFVFASVFQPNLIISIHCALDYYEISLNCIFAVF